MENVQQVKVREIMTVRTAKIRHGASLHQAAELLALTRVLRPKNWTRKQRFLDNIHGLPSPPLGFELLGRQIVQ